MASVLEQSEHSSNSRVRTGTSTSKEVIEHVSIPTTRQHCQHFQTINCAVRWKSFPSLMPITDTSQVISSSTLRQKKAASENPPPPSKTNLPGNDSDTSSSSPSSSASSSSGSSRASPPPSIPILDLFRESENLSLSPFGPAFVGSLFAVVHKDHKTLMGVGPKFNFVRSVLKQVLPEHVFRKLPEFVKRHAKQAKVFRFFVDKNDAKSYLGSVRSDLLDTEEPPSCTLSTFPLGAAHSFLEKSKNLFEIVPQKQQVEEAKRLFKLQHGKGSKSEPKVFSGVPVFTAENLAIALTTPIGLRWFAPYFFNKRELESVIHNSVRQYYQGIIEERKIIRHLQVGAGGGGSGLDADASSGLNLDGDEDVNEPSMLDPQEFADENMFPDPPEMQDFIGELMGSGMRKMDLDPGIGAYAEVAALDCVDQVLLGTRFGRRITGLEPSFPIVVDSFQKRAESSRRIAQERKLKLIAQLSQVAEDFPEDPNASSLSSPNEEDSHADNHIMQPHPSDEKGSLNAWERRGGGRDMSRIRPSDLKSQQRLAQDEKGRVSNGEHVISSEEKPPSKSGDSTNGKIEESGDSSLAMDKEGKTLVRKEGEEGKRGERRGLGEGVKQALGLVKRDAELSQPKVLMIGLVTSQAEQDISVEETLAAVREFEETASKRDAPWGDYLDTLFVANLGESSNSVEDDSI